MTTINDNVLVYLEDEPIFFARVESILPDAKKDWYHIKLLILQIPLQAVTWLLKDEYINGDTFHMNGKKMKMEKVESPLPELANSAPENHLSKDLRSHKKPSDIKPNVQSTENQTQAEIISFTDIRKNHEPDSG